MRGTQPCGSVTMFRLLLVAYVGVCLSSAQVVQDGQCDTLSVQAGFELADFTGQWYEISRIPNPYSSSDCGYIEFSVTDDGVQYTTSAVNSNFLEVANGTATYNVNDTARLTLSIESLDTDIDFWILDTDYMIYSIVYGCQNVDNTTRSITIWKFARSAAGFNDLINSLLDTTILREFNLVASEVMVYSDFSEDACYVLPVIEPGQPIVLDGQCSDNITAVQNFHFAGFLGTWQEISSYQSDTSLGSCASSLFSAVDSSTIGVVNSGVLNQTLQTSSGTVVISSEDDSGVLNVTLVSDGVSISAELMILGTDYVSFAVAYSCVNVDTTQKRVYSWIYSRTKELSATALTAVNNVIASNLDLNDRYYTPTDQTTDACFYYPEFVEGEIVVFPGTCDVDVPVMEDFDPELYMGLWHTIESYPSDTQYGTCNNANYTRTEAGFQVYQTQVLNQSLATVSGTATQVDGAQHTISLPFPDSNILSTVPYWVLDTDYTSYALVYSCENLSDGRRRVWSWKLSRTKELTTAASQTIDNITSAINVLDQRYYRTQDQSVDGCFFYPEPVAGQPVVFPGQCDQDIAAVAAFNITQFTGTWYEIESYPRAQHSGACISHDYDYTDDVFSVVSGGVNNQFQFSANGTIVAANTTDGSAKFIAQVNVEGTEVNFPYWILATDYNNYALAYSCVDLDSDFRAIWSWKLSRTQELTAASVAAINAVTAPIVVLEDTYFETIDHSAEACFFLPELEPGAPVVLDGQCDLDLAVVENFDAAAYSGTWSLIESYPTDFQDGTCQDATYTLDGDTVTVVNTQVVDEALDSITGSAVAIDGSGKLLVTLPVAGTNVTVSAELWVLATDYTSYSLAYSCQNLDTETRRIWSWKLSRTRQLTQAAATAINQVINTVQVLNNRYYEAADQSDAACFYYPEPSDSPVVFRGTCDMSIPAVADFDVDAFMGLWHDIDKYPSTYQQGSCNNIRYALNDGSENVLYNGSIDILANQVIDQSLDSTSVVSLISSNDGTGKLQIYYSGLPVPGTVTVVNTLDYWILDTDYTSYAFLYSCDQIGADQRQIYSWKLSRTKDLPAAGATAITNIINSVQVLDDRYYQSTDQSDDACFYYPEPVAGQPVVFPGQCGESVAAVANFDLARFAGLWHEIAAYPRATSSESVASRQCSNHVFNQTSDTSYTTVYSSITDYIMGISNGTAVLTSTDGSGRLTLTNHFDEAEADVSVPFWILDTDYDNFALAYSCVNLEDDMRAVWSWKLSRSQELSAASEAAITQALAPVDVLEEIYFEVTPQSDDDCFFLPDLTLEEPAVMFGQCDESIPAVQNFDPERYQGRWYDIASYYDENQQGTCNDAQYTLTAGGIVDVYNTQVVNQTLDSISGFATIEVEDGSGKLVVSFPITPEFTVTSELWILDTDYENYSLAYSCTNLPDNTRRVYSWKLSRTRELTANSSAAIDAVVDTIPVLNDRYYITRDHSESACFYYPEADPSTPVVYRGQCPSDVQAFPAFDVERYTGVWYDVGSYPQEFQFGSCPTARYTLINGTVEVYNTQVVGQQLDYIFGEAVLASDDGSAQLVVSFPIAGTPLVVESPYWVLDTDYDNYAVVYSCTNLDLENYRVTSWRLSRDRTPSAASETAFTNILSQYRDLYDDYYLNRGTTDEDCFYYPDNFGGPVLLDGLCDANQSVVANFDINQFAGTWHEISRFPSDRQVGECASAVFEVTNQQISVSQNIVYNEQLVSVAGGATVAQDGSGVLTVTYVDSAGATQTLTVYVLDTDYTSYALLFSCEDRAGSTKQVYSWKLSRTRDGLTNTANENINTVVSNNIDLFEGYYLETERGDYSCFYYPEFDDDVEAIILPGPCNNTIQAMDNFNLDAYLGRWFEVARYPQSLVSGQCARATFSLGQSGGVVYVEEVSDQTLGTTTGSMSLYGNNGSGILQVTFQEDGEDSIEYLYILDTDYNNYALLYSCQNVGDNNRQVSSWKLSRSRTLDAQYEAIMDPYITDAQGLSQDYYSTTSQSDEDCFYIPELNEDEAVLFRGQCEDVTGVAGFDVQRYLGWWHEIQSYPTGSEGQCISSQLQSSGNQYLAVDTTVVGNQGLVETSVLEVSADGRIRRTSSNGEVSDVWVLATDYDNYALLYSCVNVNDEYRRVWSAKHSKTRQLPATADAAIAPIIAANDLLQDHLYVPVSQSDADCFHYPALTGEQVILPGQCNDNIPAQQNFDALGYSGTWYQTERYPHPDEAGSCSGARYTLEEDSGIVFLVNWEVRDGELESVTGTATISSTDGSGKLWVVIPIEGTNVTVYSDLYVLSTDYITYALTYGCRNVNQYQRAVSAWKLSRTREMPASGSEAINAVVAQREELYQSYFIQVEQNDDCPEPSSAILFRSSIVLVLICALWQLAL